MRPVDIFGSLNLQTLKLLNISVTYMFTSSETSYTNSVVKISLELEREKNNSKTICAILSLAMLKVVYCFQNSMK